MKNKNFKQSLGLVVLISVLFFTTIIIINYYNIKKYQQNNNYLISNLVYLIKEKYPETDELAIIKVLNSQDIQKNDLLTQYGININNDNISLANKKLLTKIIIENIIIVGFYIILFTIIIYHFNKKEQKCIKEITNYIIELNNHNYELDILSNDEDNLSILKNEIYKTAITLNEQALNLAQDKVYLKESLEDISHQLKTPLTSITLLVETILNNNQLSLEEKNNLLINIRHKINHINFLIKSLLKLSKFDANTITFNNQNYHINKILQEVKNNLSVLCDLKDIKINIMGNNKDKLYCDYKWQVEALTNIVKNCLEYSNNSSHIDITYSINDIFTKIVIKDYGAGMTDDDLKHLFERFYKGSKSSPNSIGIGLSLAKTIIERNNGHITVTSKIGEGSIFTIKYFK